MKQILFIITLLLLTSFSYGQDSTETIKATTPKIVTKLNFGASLQYEDIRIKFVEVVQDSRCPKAVQCIWEGEVIVLIAIFKNDKKVEQKKLTISPKYSLKEQIGNLFSSERLNISGFNVLPYPVASNKIPMEDYYIQLDVRK